MKKWECVVCGVIYDEAKGWPDDGIAPGTKWADVPESWVCPDCGVGKEDFEMMEISASEAAAEASSVAQLAVVATQNAPIIIIGTGFSRYTLVKEFRRLDTEKPVIMITSDDGRSYSKPMISTGFTKNKSADELAMADAGEMAEQNKVSIRTMTKVTSIDTTKQLVHIDGESLPYSKLVINWGADTIKAPMQGDAVNEAYSLNDLMDYGRFRQAVEGKKRVLIIGAGLIGSEYANDLSHAQEQFEIEVVDPMPTVLSSLLPPEASKVVKEALEEKGVKFHFGTVVEELNRAGSGYQAKLANGVLINADLVISAIGVRPRIAMAQAAGIKVNRGIVTNRLLETSAPNVYSFGDCAEVDGHVLYFVLPLMSCARALAKTLSGTPTEVNYGAMPVAIKTTVCPVVVSPPAPGSVGSWEIEANGRDVKAFFKNSTGQILGMALTGEATKEKMALQKLLPNIMSQ